MATYKEIISYVKERNGFVAQTCWIANVKELYGLTKRDEKKGPRVKPCPKDKQSAIEDAFRHFKMI